MGPKSKLPKHVREYLSSGEYQIFSTQHPEAALTEMTFLMIHFMEKYEAKRKSSKYNDSKSPNENLASKSHYWR